MQSTDTFISATYILRCVCSDDHLHSRFFIYVFLYYSDYTSPKDYLCSDLFGYDSPQLRDRAFVTLSNEYHAREFFHSKYYGELKD